MKDVVRALQREDARALREAAKELIYKAVESYDRETAQLSVLAYAISKILSKIHIVRNPRWKEYKRLLLEALEHDYPLEKTAAIISSIDESMGNFVRSTIEKARLKMAAEAYAAGLSLRASAELTGADIHDLADYIGETRIHDEETYTIDIKKRVEGIRRLFG